MLLVFFTLTVFTQALMLEVQKRCNGDVDICIYYPNYSLIQTPQHNLQTEGVRITEYALYRYRARNYYRTSDNFRATKGFVRAKFAWQRHFVRIQ